MKTNIRNIPITVSCAFVVTNCLAQDTTQNLGNVKQVKTIDAGFNITVERGQIIIQSYLPDVI